MLQDCNWELNPEMRFTDNQNRPHLEIVSTSTTPDITQQRTWIDILVSGAVTIQELTCVRSAIKSESQKAEPDREWWGYLNGIVARYNEQDVAETHIDSSDKDEVYKAFIGRLLAKIGALGDTDWMKQARCDSKGPREFYSAEQTDENKATISKDNKRRENESKAICRKCPVKEECLEYALQHNISHGIWGGESDRSRTKIRKSRERNRSL